jgi:hypothetical protein
MYIGTTILILDHHVQKAAKLNYDIPPDPSLHINAHTVV